jgi:hypothetical protein
MNGVKRLFLNNITSSRIHGEEDQVGFMEKVFLHAFEYFYIRVFAQGMSLCVIYEDTQKQLHQMPFFLFV